MKENFEEDDDIRHLPPDIQKAIKEKKEKQKTILMLIVLISILAFGIWNNHFRKPKDDDIEQMPVIMTPQEKEEWLENQQQYSTQESAKPTQSPEEQALEDKMNEMVEDSDFFDFIRSTMGK